MKVGIPFADAPILLSVTEGSSTLKNIVMILNTNDYRLKNESFILKIKNIVCFFDE